jgi:hypothetical protein
MFLQDLNTGTKWAPSFSTLRAGEIVVWQMTIRVGSATVTVRTTKEQAEQFAKMVADSVVAASPIIVPNNVPDLLRQMKRPGGPPGANSK